MQVKADIFPANVPALGVSQARVLITENTVHVFTGPSAPAHSIAYAPGELAEPARNRYILEPSSSPVRGPIEITRGGGCGCGSALKKVPINKLALLTGDSNPGPVSYSAARFPRSIQR